MYPRAVDSSARVNEAFQSPTPKSRPSSCLEASWKTLLSARNIDGRLSSTSSNFNFLNAAAKESPAVEPGLKISVGAPSTTAEDLTVGLLGDKGAEEGEGREEDSVVPVFASSWRDIAIRIYRGFSPSRNTRPRPRTPWTLESRQEHVHRRTEIEVGRPR